MILAVHGLAGSFVARAFPSHPLWGLFFAVASHFLLDALPHWEYALGNICSDKKNRSLFSRSSLIDLAKIILDGCFGVLLPLLLFFPHTRNELFIVLMGSVGGMLPDVVEFLYWKLNWNILGYFSRFHRSCHHTSRSSVTVAGLAVRCALVVGFFSIFYFVLY